MKTDILLRKENHAFPAIVGAMRVLGHKVGGTGIICRQRRTGRGVSDAYDVHGM